VCEVPRGLWGERKRERERERERIDFKLYMFLIEIGNINK
jgi:hypothetical protein